MQFEYGTPTTITLQTTQHQTYLYHRQLVIHIHVSTQI
jgi:hypothetical protein